MLAFITTLRHPDNAADYGRVEALLKDTLRSIGNQTSDDYRVVVVGNRKPSFPLPTRTEFVRVDFPAPAAVDGVHADRDAVIRDKGTKIGIGLAAARRYGPDFIMAVDADDFVHRGLVALTQRHPGSPGWFVQRGWVYSRARGVIRWQNGFNGVCGTCLIVPWARYGVPEDLRITATQQQVVDAYGDRLVPIMGKHHGAHRWLAERGPALQRAPFRAAVYHVDTGENHSGKQLQGAALPLVPALARVFGIVPARSFGAALVDGIAPAAIRASAVASLPRWRRRLRRVGGRLVPALARPR